MREAIRVAEAVKVLQLIAGGMSQRAACREIGMSEATFRRWIARGDEALDAFRELAESVDREQLVLVKATQNRILERLLDKLTGSDPVSIRDMIDGLKYLQARDEMLTDRYHTQSRGDDSGTKYLEMKGPALKRGSSRMGARINIEPLPDGSIDVTFPRPEGEIIDVETRDD